MSNFPLYEDLKKDNPKKDLSAKCKLEFIENMKNINMDGKELIYGLIRSHQTESGENLFKNVSSTDLTFDFNNFPIILKHILHKFANKHIKIMAEDNEERDINEDFEGLGFTEI